MVLRREEQGPALAVELVSGRDLADARAELWFEAFLRRGHLDVPLESVRALPRALHHDTKDGVRVCLGFSLASATPSGEKLQCVFARGYLEPVAARMARKLIDAGTLAAGDKYFYELKDQPPSEYETEQFEHETGAVAKVVAPARRSADSTSFAVLRTPLAPLLEGAEEVNADQGDAGDYPVFFTREARAKAEAAARKGAASHPPIETGGLLVGPLCSCPDTGALFAVVVDVLEAAHSEGTTYSLTYSGKTWARIQTVMRAKQAHPATASHRLLGQVHGHSFLPMEGATPCEECEARPVCSRTTAFLSAEDLAWCRAVFRSEPWQLSQVFGLDARGEGVEAFYGQSGGLLVPRSYQLLDTFDSH